MSNIIKHRNINIVTLEAGDTITTHCKGGDIALTQEGDGWGVHFIDEDGSIESYDQPFESYNKALWSAKAAAEFGTDGAE